MSTLVASRIASGRLGGRKRRLTKSFGLVLCCFAILHLYSEWKRSGKDDLQSTAERRLEERGGDDYDEYSGVCDSWLEREHRTFAIVLLIFGVLYMFWGLAIICDDFFVGALDVISQELDLSEDVAGATFMAAGSSAPELFTSIMGVFAVHSDVGVGTIIGSAVFNICVIIGGTGMFAGNDLKLDWRPLTRDCFFYSFSILLMFVFMRSESKVTAPEGGVLVAFYFVYIWTMYKNDALMVFMASLCAGGGDNSNGSGPAGKLALGKMGSENPDEEKNGDGGDIPTPRRTPRQRMEDMQEKSAMDDEVPEAEGEPGIMDKLNEAISKPWENVLTWTIPNCTEESTRKYYMGTFFMSITWIGMSTYLMVLWASKLGCFWEIHPAVMGLTVLAAGTSVPDGLASLIVAKDGQGDMAVSNAIGSNVFDICLGLGVPWCVQGILKTGGVDYTPVDTDNIIQFVGLLIVWLFLVVGTIACSNWVLNQCVGVIFFLLYFIFLGIALVLEFHLN